MNFHFFQISFQENYLLVEHCKELGLRRGFLTSFVSKGTSSFNKGLSPNPEVKKK